MINNIKENKDIKLDDEKERDNKIYDYYYNKRNLKQIFINYILFKYLFSGYKIINNNEYEIDDFDEEIPYNFNLYEFSYNNILNTFN